LKSLSIVFLFGLLTACSSSDDLFMDSFQTWETRYSDVTELTEQLRSPQITTVSLNHLDFQKVSLERNNRIEITTDSPIVSFPEGNSYVAALFLPEYISRFTFNLKSDAGRTVFVPSVIFLDKNRQEVFRIDDAQFDAKGFFSINESVNTERAQTIRYILIYSKNSDLDGKSEMQDIAREYELKKGAELSEASYPKLYAKHSPIGRVDVNIEQIFYSADVITEVSAQNKTEIPNVAPIIMAPTILSDTEDFYLRQIHKAVKENNLSRAVSLVEEAQRAGSKKAKSYYMAELGKQQ